MPEISVIVPVYKVQEFLPRLSRQPDRPDLPGL